MNMSDTISNNSTIIKENKKLDIYEDNISLNSNNLIKNELVVKDAKINLNKHDEGDDWIYVEKK
jgi:hypothetical protein